MKPRRLHQCLTLLLTAALVACGSGGVDFGRTIADLEELENMPPIIDSVELEPGASFEIDPQQVIDSFRKLVEITNAGGGSGDEIRRLADLELENSLDRRLSDEETTRQDGIENTAKAIQIYKDYLIQYPDREDNDRALYQLSRAYAIEANSEKSLKALDQIARDYPKSEYVDEVQFRRGEFLFVDREFAAAATAYGTVVRDHPESVFFDKALYKYGWSLFKQSEYEAALNHFLQLLDLNHSKGKIGEIEFDSELTRAEKELLEDVVRVVALTFSYQPQDYITDYFESAEKRDYEPLIYLKLGELYLEKSRVVDGSDLFLAFTQEYPVSAHAPYFQQRAIEVYKQAGYTDRVLQEKVTYVNRYDVGGEYWLLQSTATLEQIKPTLVLHFNELATHFHALARSSKKPSDFQASVDWYRRFLKSLPEDPAAPRMNFLMAEILFDASQFPQAIDEYQKTAYNYPKHGDSAEAGYAALVAYDAMFKSTKASDVEALRRKRAKSAVRFTTNFPGDKRLQAVELQTAQQYFQWKEFSDAIASASRLIENDRVTPAIKLTAKTIRADAQFSLADYPAAEASYLAILDIMPQQSKNRKAVREQIAASIYKQGEAAQKTNSNLIAAKHFTRLGELIPESPKRKNADYDAATAYVSLKNWPAAIKLLESFRKRNPRDKEFKLGVAEKLALAYSENGDQLPAAREMITLSELPASAERKQELLWGAAELFEASGAEVETIGAYINYIRKYPFPMARSMELRHKVAEHYRAKNDRKRVRYWLQEIVNADAIAKNDGNERSNYLAANASLELITPLHQSYRRAKLTVPLKASLQTKKKLMEKSIDAYSKAMQYRVEEVTTASTFQIGEIYNDFAKSLMDSQRPKGLNEEQLEEYDLLLEEQAFPFEEKAIDIHLANFKRIPTGTYDEPTRKSLEMLGKLMPFRFAKVESTDVYVEIQ